MEKNLINMYDNIMLQIKITDLTPKVNFSNFTSIPENEVAWGPRTIPDFEFILIIQGTFTYIESREKTYVNLAPGDILLIPPAREHTLKKLPGPGHFSCVHHEPVSEFTWSDRHYNLEPAQCLVYPQAGTPYLTERFRRLWLLFSGNSKHREELMSCVMKEIWLSLYEEGTEDDPKLNRLRPMLAYLRRNLKRNVSRQELSNQFYLSPGHINKIFLENIGKSPTKYLHYLRIEKSKDLLGDASKNLAEIADELGFYDAFHFSKVFRRETGISPKEFRHDNSEENS